uniref:uncharacterized protein LOC120345304 isoform X1 n=1 Tax=Styela clava TaxID=7725 RepID=UPI001939A5D6|nr:uncharacterized protein LOC120345304 isoform X1 [Styela clava]
MYSTWHASRFYVFHSMLMILEICFAIPYLKTVNETCDDLNYNRQYCHVDKVELDCLRRKALMQNMTTCNQFKHGVNPSDESCIYVEVCIFADADFVCNNSYKCYANVTDHITCNATGLRSYSPTCNKSLIHCSTNECNHLFNLNKQFRGIYKDDCKFESTETTYWIDQTHFDNLSTGYGRIHILHLAAGDKNNYCAPDDQEQVHPSQYIWKYIVLIIAVFIVLVIAALGVWKLIYHREEEHKMWEAKIQKSICKIITDVEGALDVDSIIFTPEEPEPVPREGVSLPCSREKISNVAGNGLDPASAYECIFPDSNRDSRRIHSHDNPIYSGVSESGMYANSSISSLSESVWSKGDDVLATDSDTASGYSGKLASDMPFSGSSSFSPVSNMDMIKLDPISETESVKDEHEGFRASEISNLIDSIGSKKLAQVKIKILFRSCF